MLAVRRSVEARRRDHFRTPDWACWQTGLFRWKRFNMHGEVATTAGMAMAGRDRAGIGAATPDVTPLAGVAALAGMVGSGAAAAGMATPGAEAPGVVAAGMAAAGMAVEDAGTVAVVGAAKAWFGDKDHEKKR